ncbi:hypothetical protein KQI89_11815 [Clostridium sp. MSJ-4]|uniref:Transcription regulator TrmB N-terminal domain-containing protein n=1 Tax=Clostridium simiarum TaxID=2841506 RepID=A0ABS6F2G0_9CLOT|nr:helix-turn-helix domain-containing protein [Clostridium simiarum]MBU5592443.1 hypothetical protein [Clostridium simiarum]
MIEELKKIGLTELEGKCYLSLYENPNQTGYEVAKNISSSRSNVYAALNSLYKKGACQVMEGKNTTYSAVSVEELLSKLRLEFKQSATLLQRELKKKERSTYDFYNTQGIEPIQSVIKRSIAHAKKSVLADIWPQDMPLFLPLLEQAESKGLEVVLVTFEPVETTLKNIFVDLKSGGNEENEISDFSLLFDQEKAIIGSLDDRLIPSAVETKHPAIIQKVLSAFHHDLVMNQLNKDFGSEFIAKYGKNFEKIFEATQTKIK